MSLISLVSAALTIFICFYFSEWIDQKVTADIQARVGPNRAGKAGLLQPLADFIRLVSKQESSKKEPVTASFSWAQGLLLVFMVFFIPFGAGRPFIELSAGPVVPVILLLFFCWAGLLWAWRAERIQPRLISIRQANLCVGVLVPTLVSLSLAGMTQGGLSWERLVFEQGFWPHQWLAFSGPFCFFSAIVFLTAGMIIFSVGPFSYGGFSEVFLISGRSGRQGFHELWIQFSRRLGLFCWQVIFIQVFLGGTNLPEVATEALTAESLSLAFFGTLLLSTKVLFLSFIIVVISRALPAVRSEQSHRLIWKFLFPLMIASLVVSRVFFTIIRGAGT